MTEPRSRRSPATSTLPDPAGSERADRRLYLLRHAKSSWKDPSLDDIDRPLAPRGTRAAKKIARHVRGLDMPPDLILCSPARRARETLEDILRKLPGNADVRVEPELYEASVMELLSLLRRTPDPVRSLMVVGHNPGLQQLAIELAPDSTGSLMAKFPTGALAAFALRGRWTELGPDRVELLDVVVPRDLA